ncbi:uncharacterized protein BO95DRAFT_132048 [Aspergillus brunneoviolaceus CBS 621.78]|uniref:Uncharacterized protein n=1 Tax=Aspergillus brunneoviolaceus CBS 621.78 TaxID=1450534 RepID=A0ACD1G8Y5_9EURO|nr:hypothetical protein BO95DRAFT_132048 [Aspergillus brunneoviolaceus CBS 621.78]RAH45695.1 hypothetical protein BO95DRAFT_132048 [Aspergillus brunneoviolaceus CBS 621.78]
MVVDFHKAYSGHGHACFTNQPLYRYSLLPSQHKHSESLLWPWPFLKSSISTDTESQRRPAGNQRSLKPSSASIPQFRQIINHTSMVVTTKGNGRPMSMEGDTEERNPFWF